MVSCALYHQELSPLRFGAPESIITSYTALEYSQSCRRRDRYEMRRGRAIAGMR